ncbi:unnamed protein product [Prunus armeniaca]
MVGGTNRCLNFYYMSAFYLLPPLTLTLTNILLGCLKTTVNRHAVVLIYVTRRLFCKNRRLILVDFYFYFFPLCSLLCQYSSVSLLVFLLYYMYDFIVCEMDKSWMHADRRSKAYELGVEGFLNFALENHGNTTHIRCPCVKCENIRLFGVGIIRDHLYFNGIGQSYKIWTWHREPWEWTTNARRNVEEDEHSRFSFVYEEIGMDDNDLGDIGFDPYEFANVIGDRDCTLVAVKLLILQGDLLTEGNTLPSSMYEAKKTLSALGMSYEKIHACPNDCILYMKDYENSTNCPTYGVSRWKEGKDSILKEGVPTKVVWYFPQIPRFKRMIQSHKTTKSLTWHAARKSVDVNDFPAYDNLSGCVVKGYKVWPICCDDTPSHRQRAAFNGKPEYGTPPEPLTREEVLHMVEDINYIWGSKNGGSVRENDGDKVCWKKKSKFFDLEYWKYLHVRHVLDVMHIEKNVCDSIIGTLLEILGKNKDGIASRLDLLNMGVKTNLQPEYGKRCTLLPLGPWNLSRVEKKAVCNSFYGMKVPEDSRLLGLKSHDCHTLMQQLLHVAICSVLEKPARYMKVLKGYVQNRTRPEGCIAERYIVEEAVEFCIEHLSDVSTVGVPSSQKMGVSKPLSSCTVSLVDWDLLNQAHLYILENTEEVLPYIEEHMIHIKTTYPKFRKRTKWLQDKHNNPFIQWLHLKVQSELNGKEHNSVSENLRWLAAGRSMAMPSYRSHLINGVKFNTKA